MNKPLGSIVIYNENNKEDHKEYVINDLKDIEVLTKMKKLKSLYMLDWNDLDNLESLLESASLKEIYLGSNIYEKYFGLLGNKFEEKNIKVLKTDLNRTKIFV